MIHLAGPYEGDGTQACVRCGALLTDHRNTMVPEGTPPMRGWEEGAHVEITEGFPRAYWVTDDVPDCETRQ